MTGFGFGYLVSMFLPGSFLLAACAVALRKVDPRAAQIAWAFLAGNEWLAVIVLTLGAVFLGIFLSSIWDWIETHHSDSKRASELGISRRQYEEEWNLYVDDLKPEQNPYVSRMVLFWRFESRCALALLALALTLLVIGVTSTIRLCGVLTLLASVVLYLAGERSHRWLAKYRHRHYGEKVSAKEPLPNSAKITWELDTGLRVRLGKVFLRTALRLLKGGQESIAPAGDAA